MLQYISSESQGQNYVRMHRILARQGYCIQISLEVIPADVIIGHARLKIRFYNSIRRGRIDTATNTIEPIRMLSSQCSMPERKNNNNNKKKVHYQEGKKVIPYEENNWNMQNKCKHAEFE